MAALRADPPLSPDGDEGRRLLRNELLDPDYHTDDLLQRVLDWIARVIDDVFGRAFAAASGSNLVTALVAILVALGLLAAVLLLLSRFRRTARAEADRRPALPEDPVSAAELRDRATAALTAGRYDEAVIEGFRALAVQQIEFGRIDDLPQATAHELADALAAVHRDDASDLLSAADTFDAVRYGDHTASQSQAQAVLALDEHLRLVRR
jgi:hypothetical protein